MSNIIKKKARSLFLDFEFNGVTEEFVNLVCCATYDKSNNKKIKWWLHKDPKEKERLKKYLLQFDTFIAYSAIAECRSFLSLGLDPLQFNWLDLFLEYRCLTNHNDRLLYGKQLVDGKVRFMRKPLPKWQREKGAAAGGFSPTHSLAEATYKLLGVIRDTDHKNKMRDLIISAPEKFTREEREAIIDYCMDDVISLPDMWEACKKEYKELLGANLYNEKLLIKDTLLRGRYSAHTSIMENRGYPIDVEKTKNFSRQVGNIIYDMQKEINGYFPDIMPFRWNKKEGRFSENQKNIKMWITHNSGKLKEWPRTEKMHLSLALESFTKFYTYQHDYPTDHFGAQMIRYLKLKQSIYGFSRSKDKNKKTFWDSVGSDGRVRPYLNIYKAQSSRSQPAATGFMFLKPAWMRALVQPAKGKFLAGIDYGSQEFFLAAILSRDSNMIKSYLSGDPYLAFGKLSGQIPPEGTKQTHGAIRDLCKSTILGISYLMSKYGLAFKLSADSGRDWTEKEAQDQIDLFYKSYFNLKEFQEDVITDYESMGHIRLKCGWYMWGGNENFRSTTNVVIQGNSASIMRKAVDLAVAKGIYIPFTLHDALYMEDDIGNEWKIKVLADCMREAFIYYLDKDMKDTGSKIRLDPFAWSPNYKPNSEIDIKGFKVPSSNLYLDDRAEKDYKKFSKYFDKQKWDSL